MGIKLTILMLQVRKIRYLDNWIRLYNMFDSHLERGTPSIKQKQLCYVRELNANKDTSMKATRHFEALKGGHLTSTHLSFTQKFANSKEFSHKLATQNSP